MESAFFKNANNPKCIGLVMTNRSRSSQYPCVTETGWTFPHEMARLHISFPKIRNTEYRDYEFFLK